MIAMARHRPRRKDGCRTLRFLTRLAMLALAVTLHLPFAGAARVSPAAALPAVAVSTITVTESENSSATREDHLSPRQGEFRSAAEDVAADGAGPVAAAAGSPTGRAVQAAGSRAPPAR